MNRLLFTLLATVLICVIIVPTQTFAQASISIDHVDSLYNGKIQPDQPIKFHIRWTNNTENNIGTQTTGYKIYLSNNGDLLGGMFEIPVPELMPFDFSMMFDLHFAVNEFTNGVGADTIGVGGSQLFNGGLPIGFDEIVFNISTSVSSDFAGDSLCIDSSFYPPSGAWLWSSYGPPEWGGPYCYEILPSCCTGIRGNFNNSINDRLDVQDLDDLIHFMFLGGAPSPCAEEADINGDGELNVMDLVALVDYMFLNGPPPADCQ